MAKAGSGLEKLLAQLVKDGFAHKAIVSDDQMGKLIEAFDAQKGVISTPDDEIRYIEGLAELPFRYLTEFKVIPASGHAKCACGRTPSALDIVNAAVKRRIHDKSLIRDALIGFENLVEIAQNGRQGECVSCGRSLLMSGYRTRKYLYA